jgi:hypothetical protein
MKLTITIEMDNAAFGDDEESRLCEVEHILHHWRYVNLSPNNDGPLTDSNGNKVGEWRVSE